jgi:small subunit ribosomal protein S14
MRKYLIKDLKRRKLVKKYEKKKLLLKAILSNINIPIKLRMEAQFLLSKLPRNSSVVRIRNRSLINGKSRGVLRKYGIDRVTFREWALKGLIPGCATYTW